MGAMLDGAVIQRLARMALVEFEADYPGPFETALHRVIDFGVWADGQESGASNALYERYRAAYLADAGSDPIDGEAVWDSVREEARELL